jgi:uncharacterized protein (TIGR03083 family)
MMELISPHRAALAEALSELTADQWAGATLCAGWTPGHVLAHLTMPYRISEQDFMQGLQRCGGDFTRFSDVLAETDGEIPQAELTGVLAANAGTPWAPPGGGLAGALSHDVIHGLDICWPLGLEYQIPGRAMTTVLDSVTSALPPEAAATLAAGLHPEAGRTTLFGFPLDGIKVSATDLGWSAGQGAELTGRGRDLLPLLAGRQVPRELFGGPGAALAWSLAGR